MRVNRALVALRVCWLQLLGWLSLSLSGLIIVVAIRFLAESVYEDAGRFELRPEDILVGCSILLATQGYHYGRYIKRVFGTPTSTNTKIPNPWGGLWSHWWVALSAMMLTLGAFGVREPVVVATANKICYVLSGVAVLWAVALWLQQRADDDAITDREFGRKKAEAGTPPDNLAKAGQELAKERRN